MKFIWAFDPQRNPKDSLQIIKEVKFWAHRLDATVLPVCVISDAILKVKGIDLDIKAYQLHLNKMIFGYLSHCSIKGFLAPKILHTPETSRRKLALTLAEYAKETNADIIFINSHEKSSWKPFRLGGFCQALIEQSHTALLVLNPSTAHSEKISTVVYPTDFERASKLGLAHLAPWAKSFGATVLLFNRIAVSVYYLAGTSSFPAFGNAEYIIENLTAIRRKQAHKWKERLRHFQVPSTDKIDKERKSLADDIVTYARKENADLIAIVNTRQPKAERILSSTARDVLIRSHCPVMILRP